MGKRLAIPLVTLAVLLVTKAEGKRRFKYYLNPDRAEEILASIPLNQSTSRDKWLSILGSRRNQNLSIEPGDNLWSIAGKSLGNPFLWRKLWQQNPFLGNPHALSVGQILSYYRESLEERQEEIPLIHLIPARAGIAKELESDSIINPETKYRYRPAFFVVKEEDMVGEIAGAYAQQEWLGQGEEFYVKLIPGEKTDGQRRFSVVHVERNISDTTSWWRPSLGILVRLVGEVETIANRGDHLSKAVLTRHLEVFKRGDRLMPLLPTVKPFPIFYPPEELQARILLGELDEAKLFSKGQVVLINKGEEDGMKGGFLFRAVEHTDPFLHSTSHVAPDSKGEVQVISVGHSTSIGFIVRNEIPLTIGDTLVPAQLFPDRPPRPKRLAKEIEFD